MSNERLRSALLAQGMTVQSLATAIEVSQKTVERWITQGKVPYRRHQYATASALKVDVTTLWPDDGRAVESATDLSRAEIVTVYPHRHTVPPGLWREMYARAREHLDVLVYSGLFLSEDPAVLNIFKAKAGSARVRVLLGDPGSAAVRQRGVDEGHQIMDGKIRNALLNYRPVVASHPEIDLRLHDTTLYNSIYRADDEMLVNPHVYGIGAYLAPVFHLRRLPGGGLFDTYANSIEHTWEGARKVTDRDITGG